MIIIRVAIMISVVFYLYFIINLLLINHYREPIQNYEKGPTPYELFWLFRCSMKSTLSRERLRN